MRRMLGKSPGWRTNSGCDSRFIIAVFGCILLAPTAVANARDAGENWVGTWATAPIKDVATAQSGPAPDFADSTLRQIVHVSIGGKRLRVKFSNAFGTTALRLGSAHVALSAGGGSIKP